MPEEHFKTAQELINETEKWLKKIEDIPIPQTKTKLEVQAWENVQAYVDDAKFFKDKKDWVRAFEACIWAWAFYEVVFKFPKE